MNNQIKEILKENKRLQKVYYATLEEAEQIKKDIIAPCQWCKYDGDFRCDACSSNFFEGYNVKNYPN